VSIVGCCFACIGIAYCVKICFSICKNQNEQKEHKAVDDQNWLYPESKPLLHDEGLDANIQCTIFRGNYEQYGVAHPMDPFSMHFTPTENGNSYKITGKGTDTVGQYLLLGVLNMDCGRMSIAKTYSMGTGDPTQNLGHTVQLRLAWDSNA